MSQVDYIWIVLAREKMSIPTLNFDSVFSTLLCGETTPLQNASTGHDFVLRVDSPSTFSIDPNISKVK